MMMKVNELAEILLSKKLLLATAESCTGGMIAAAITGRAGSSTIFDRGFITYSNASKQDLLGVPEDVIAQFGAVSAETAAAMATGALKNSQADITVSVTGIAGPSGGSDEKPVGLVYIGIATLSHHAFVEEMRFEGEREDIRAKAAAEALSLLIKAAEAI